MKKYVDIKLLEPYKEALLKRCSFLYGIDYANTLRIRLDSIKNVIITDELGKNVSMEYSIVKKSIFINSKLTEGINKSPIEFSKATEVFKLSLIHELLHSASTRNNSSGIIESFDKVYKLYLNEGITQLISNDICGYSENKFIDGYNIIKIIASIIRDCVGNKIFIDSYFLNPKLLEDALNNISGINNYYVFLNTMLTNYNKSTDSTEKERLNILLKSVVLNFIIPMYNKIDINKRQIFLSRIIYDISGDEEIKNKILGYIEEYISLSKKEANIRKIELLDSYKKVEGESDAIKEIPNIDKFLIRDDGSIYLISDSSKKITKHSDKEKIYFKLFQLNGYEKYMTPKVIKNYVDCILRGQPLIIKNNSVLKRRILFVGIKEYLKNEGYIILNDFEELDKKDSIKVDFIKEKKDFNDYKKLCEVFSLCKNRVGKKEYNYSIVYKSTKNELEDKQLKKYAFYALNWMNSLGGFEKAFSKENEKTFNELYNLLINYRKTHYSFNVNEIEKFSKNKNLIRKLFETPIQVEWIFDFISPDIYIEYPLNSRNGLSFKEVLNSNYKVNNSKEEADFLVKKSR